MKIFDCFSFFNEVEVLELRLMELYEIVDYFVLVEANKTHTGKPKEFIFEKNKELYKKYLDKIIHVKVYDAPEYSSEYVSRIENFQRNAIMRGLAGRAEPGDKIMVSDADEIPSVQAIKDNIDNPDWVFLQQTLFNYYVNCQVVRSLGSTVMAPYGTFKEPQELRTFAKKRFRCSPGRLPGIYPNGGWHYSYLTGGDPEKIRYKVENVYESEAIIGLLGGPEEVAEKVAKHKDLFGRTKWSYEQKIVDISETKPKSMDEFLKKYPHFFYRGPEQPPDIKR